MINKLTLMIIAIAAMVAIACGGDATATPIPPTATPEPQTAAYTPVFETVDCWSQMPESKPVDCGYLIVPEDRSDPDSPDIRLAVAILRQPGGNAEPDPIIQLHGGPGGGMVRIVNLVYEEFKPLLAANRDLILFDQRGVGLSEPALECPEYTRAVIDVQDYEVEATQLPKGNYHDYLVAKAGECFDELSKVANLSMYDSTNSAADVNDLRIALGYDKINLHGESYGGGLAQSVMRDYPDVIRSAVLDAPSDLGVAVDSSARGLLHAFDQTFNECAADDACNDAFPDLRDTWLEALELANSQAVTIEAIDDFSGESFGVLVDGNSLTFPLRFMHSSTGALGMVPLYIDMASKGDYSLVAAGWGSIAFKFQYFSLGALYSVNCSEVVTHSNRDELDAIIAESPSIADYYKHGPLDGTFWFPLCEAWKVAPPPAKENQLVVTDIPSLLLVGQFDSAINVERLDGIAVGMKNSFGPYVFPAMGHVVTIGGPECPTSIAVNFIIDPSAEPDSSCIPQMGGPDFVLEASGGGDIELVPYTGELFQGVVPDGWNEIGPGFFARGNPAVDKTLFVQSAAPSEAAGDLIAGLLGEFGIAQLPDPLRTIPSDTLTWKIHLPAGVVPIIIAVAETDEATYVAALIAAPAEMDALADSVLIPALMALTPN